MQYRPFGTLGFDISTLGFGCMRLPLKAKTPGAHGNVIAEGDIDEDLAISLIRHAIDKGVNYVDTAYNYHTEQSERVVAKALQDGYRDKVKLATKLPGWLVKEYGDFDRLLNLQLEKLQTDHIDFYLLHALHHDLWEKLKDLGVLKFLDAAVEDGRIRFPAFSIHDSSDVFKDILDAYSWSMCQIQMNYMDEDYQAGLEGMQYAGYKGVPVVIMEPLLGGKLAKKPPMDVQAVWDKAKNKWSPAEWAFRWVANFPETTVVLSGMNSMAQLEENLKIFSKAKAEDLSLQELALVDEVKKIYRRRTVVNCTQCHYCMPCPAKVDIPGILTQYNDLSMYDSVDGAFVTYASAQSSGTDASRCVACGHCEEHCPQGIQIIDTLKTAHKSLTS